jgi:hypothetical protein
MDERWWANACELAYPGASIQQLLQVRLLVWKMTS